MVDCWTWAIDAGPVYSVFADNGAVRFTDSCGHVNTMKPNSTDVVSAIQERSKQSPGRWERATRTPGEFHPRIHRRGRRGGPFKPDMSVLFPEAFQSCRRSARGLFQRLGAVFQVLEPHNDNLDAYGHELRHLHILACTEVESNLKAVMNANGGRPKGKNLSISDYHRLDDPMRLTEWVIELPSHPNLTPVCPFAGWHAGQAPRWWTAYNAVKHNREENLSEATLRCVIDALAAVYVTVAAQFGVEQLHLHHGAMVVVEELLARDFPKWEPTEFYLPPQVPGGHADWTEVPLFPTG
jgi:hypothetical protein